METSTEHRAFLMLLALVTVAFCWLLLPFYGAVFWAVVLAIVFHPLQRRLELRFGPRSNIAALISVLVCIVIAVIPVTFVFSSLIAEGTRLVELAQSNELDLPADLTEVQDLLPSWAQTWLDRAGLGETSALRNRLTELVRQTGQFLGTRVLVVGQNTLWFIGSTGVMLYVLFFLFRDGRMIGRNIREAMPLSRNYGGRLLAIFAAVVRATVKGNVIIAVLQGSIGGVTFWLLGIPAALLWGAVMVVLSLLPAVGSFLIWAPVAAFLLLSGAWLKGLILIGVGAGIIGLIDNLLRPTLVGRDTRLPDYVILVSTLGGLALFGINGFVIGPLIAALFVACWKLFREEQRGKRSPPA